MNSVRDWLNLKVGLKKQPHADVKHIQAAGYVGLEFESRKEFKSKVLEAGKSKIKVPAHSVSSENSLSGLQMAIFCYGLTWPFLGACIWGGEHLMSLPLFIRVLIPS